MNAEQKKFVWTAQKLGREFMQQQVLKIAAQENGITRFFVRESWPTNDSYVEAFMRACLAAHGSYHCVIYSNRKHEYCQTETYFATSFATDINGLLRWWDEIAEACCLKILGHLVALNAPAKRERAQVDFKDPTCDRFDLNQSACMEIHRRMILGYFPKWRGSALTWQMIQILRTWNVGVFWIWDVALIPYSVVLVFRNQAQRECLLGLDSGCGDLTDKVAHLLADRLQRAKLPGQLLCPALSELVEKRRTEPVRLVENGK